jgi:hypothetical protein
MSKPDAMTEEETSPVKNSNSHGATACEPPTVIGGIGDDMKSAVSTVLTVAALTVGVALPAAAQDVSVGYQFQRVSNGRRLNLPAGFNVDASFPVGSGLRALGQLDWSRKSVSETIGETSVEDSTTLIAYGGGIRWGGVGNGGTAPFIQLVLGAMRASDSCTISGVDLCDEPSESDLMMQVGGGIARPFTPAIALVGQVDYRRIFAEGSARNTFRIVGGIRLKLSR